MMPDSSLVIQHIHIRWTKASRGGALAEKRNRIANSFSIPTAPPAYDHNAHYLVHHVGFGERNEFAEPLRSEILLPTADTEFSTTNCTVEIANDTARVTYEWRNGAPERKFFDKCGTTVPVRKQMSARLNQWVRLEYNGRFTGYDCGNWWYEHSIINVALVDRDNPELFVVSKPTEVSRQLENLW